MDIKAFKGFRFDGQVVGNAADCICPPYDVIDEAMRQKLYAKSEYNAARIVRSVPQPSDSPDEHYIRAGASLNDWIAGGALKQDSKNTIYAYVQDFEIGGTNCRRSGFVALGKLEEFGEGVKPHEKTLDGPKADRLKLMRQKAAQLGQIFMLYDDAEMVADEIIADARSAAALVDFVDDNGVRHRLFAIDDTGQVTAIEAMMTDKQAVIADGHHRYETALNYYHETKNPAAQYRMMTFVNMRNEGLVVLPTHRLIANVGGFDRDSLIEKLKNEFEIISYEFESDEQKEVKRGEMFDRLNAELKAGKNAFGIYAGGDIFYMAVLQDAASMEQFGEMSPAAKRLDVNVLHRLILDNVLGIGGKQLASQSNVTYIKDIGDAIEQSVASVDRAQSQAVFFMNPTRVEQVQDIAAAGEKMPQKSTFFYPKVYTGLVINKL